MSNNHQIKTHSNQNNNLSIPPKTSALERFSLGFEYDKTLQEIKREVRIRTI